MSSPIDSDSACSWRFWGSERPFNDVQATPSSDEPPSLDGPPTLLRLISLSMVTELQSFSTYVWIIRGFDGWLFVVCRGNFDYVLIFDVDQTKRGKKRSSVVVEWTNRELLRKNSPSRRKKENLIINRVWQIENRADECTSPTKTPLLLSHRPS